LTNQINDIKDLPEPLPGTTFHPSLAVFGQPCYFWESYYNLYFKKDEEDEQSIAINVSQSSIIQLETGLCAVWVDVARNRLYSKDYSISWGDEQEICHQLSSPEKASPYITASPTEKVVLWRDLQYGVPVIYYSERYEDQWSIPQILYKDPENADVSNPFGIVTFEDGYVLHAIFKKGDALPYEIKHISIPLSPQVTINKPTEGEILRVSQSYNIIWSAEDNTGIDHFDIKLSTDGGNTWDYTIVSELPASATSYSWTPDGNTPLSNNSKIKVIATDLQGNTGEGVSDWFILTNELVFNAGFEEIVPEPLIGWQPHGDGDIYEASQDNPHTGNYSAHIGRADNTGNWVFLSQIGIPCETNTNYWLTGWMRGANVTGYATIEFGEWPGNHNHTTNISGTTDWTYGYASWNSVSKEEIEIHLTGNQDFTGDVYFDDINLVIDTEPPEVTLTYPTVGTEIYCSGEQVEITGNAIDNVAVDSVQIWYTTNYQESQTEWIYEGKVEIYGNGAFTYTWVFPQTHSDNCNIKLVAFDVEEQSSEYEMSGTFSIIDDIPPEVTVIAPNGGEVWEINKIYTLEWQASDNVGIEGQDLYYSTDMGINWQDLVPASPISQSGELYNCEWKIPTVYSEECLVKVECMDGKNNIGGDTSDDLFTIGDFTSPVVTVKRPNGGENLEINSIYSIGWEAYDNVRIAHQNLYYSTDNGLTWASILMEHPVQESSYIYPWDVPEAPSSECLIKVESYDKAENKGEDDSNAPFKISWLVSDNEDATGYSPKVVKNNGDLHLIFTSNDSIYYSNSTDNGQTFTKKLFIAVGHYPTIVSDGAENIYILWTDGNKIYYKRSDGIFWFPSEILATISDVTELRQVIGCIDNTGNLQMTFEGKFTFTRAIPRNIVYYGKMKKDSPNTFTYDKVTENSTLDESARISFGIDASSVAYLAFSHNGEVYSYSNERGYWAGVIKVGDGSEANLDAYDGYVHIVWEQDGAIKHRQRLIGGDWLSEETAAEESGKRLSHPVMDKGCVIVFTESPAPQPDHFSDVVYKIKNRGYWQEKQHITEIMSAGYPQIYVEEYRRGKALSSERSGLHTPSASQTPLSRGDYTLSAERRNEVASKANNKGILAMTDEVSRRASSATPENISNNRSCCTPKKNHRDANATLYTIYTEGSFTPNSVEMVRRDITIPYQTSDILQATAYNFQDKVVKDNNGVIHIVYQDRDTVLYAYSVDEGRTFSEDITLGQGRAPVICLLPDNTVGVLCSANSGDHRLVYRKGSKQNWTEAVPLYRTLQSDIFIQPPNFAVDEDGIAYVTLEREQYLIGNSYNWWLSCGSFDAMNPAPVENWSGIDSLLNIPEPTPPPPVHGTVASSDILYDSGTIHLLWSRPTGGIYYSRSRGIPDWRTAFRISLQIDRSFHPSISIYEGRLGCVWQAGDMPEVYYTYTDDYENWAIPENISNTPLGSYSPVISADAFILWSEENDAGKTDIVLSSFDRADWTKQNITETDKYTSYPHPVISGYPEGKLGVLYTEGDTHPFNVRYITEDVIIPYHTSNTEKATGINSQQKMVIARNGLVHLVFDSDGHIFYTTSIDGEKWSLEEYIGDGAAPAISLDSEDEPVCVWVKKPYSPSEPYLLMFSRKGAEGWTQPEPLYTSNYYIETPAFAIQKGPGVGGMNADTGYVAFEQGFSFEPDEHSQLIFGEFGLSGFGNIPGEISTEVIDDAVGIRGVKTPSLSISNSTVHLVYERNYELIYTRNYIAGMGPIKMRVWTGKEEVSPVGMVSTNPSIDCYGLGFNIVWEGDGDVYHIRCNLAPDPQIIPLIREYWGEVENVSQSANMVSLSPVVCCGSQVMWCEKEEEVEPGKFKLYFSRFNGRNWDVPRCLTEPSINERYPQMLFKDNELY